LFLLCIQSVTYLDEGLEPATSAVLGLLSANQTIVRPLHRMTGTQKVSNIEHLCAQSGASIFVMDNKQIPVKQAMKEESLDCQCDICTGARRGIEADEQRRIHLMKRVARQ
jgi:hypothetical protein